MTYELYHHGILGMKWGVRRYQNKDGSLTRAGRIRYLNEDGSLSEEGKKWHESLSDDEKRFIELSKKNPSQLSTQELQFMNARIQSKSQYLSNTENKLAKDAKQIARNITVGTITALGSEYLKKGIKSVGKYSNEKVSSLRKEKAPSSESSNKEKASSSKGFDAFDILSAVGMISGLRTLWRLL